MRKLNALIMSLCFMLLIGCDDTPFDPADTEKHCRDGYYLVDDACEKYAGDIIEAAGELVVQDRASEYVILKDSLNYYHFFQDGETPYVDIEEFMQLMSPVLADFTIRKLGVMTISVTPPSEQGKLFPQSIRLEIDAAKNTLYYNDFGFDSALYTPGLTQYDTDLQVVGYAASDVDASKTIDLDEYDIEIVKFEAGYYVPLYLANLLFTGDALNVYQQGNLLFIVDDIENIVDLFDSIRLDTVADEANLVGNTTQFAALLFDHFYGLKSTFGVSSYAAQFETAGYDKIETIAEFDARFQSFIYQLDDLHTSIVDYGYGGDNVRAVTPPSNSRLIEFYMELMARGALERTAELKLVEYPAYYVLEVNAFDLKTKEKLAAMLDDIDPAKDIIIDLSCNTGGSIIAVFELLSYLTDDPITISYQNPATGEHYVESYRAATSRALPNTFYVYTSRVTFSAANLFTSIVKEQNLAFIFGQPTMGGAAAVSYAILPNSLVMTYSTNLVFTDADEEVIEYGIQPDWVMNDEDTLQESIDMLANLLMNKIQPRIVDRSTVGNIDLTWEIVGAPEELTIDEYVIEVYDKDTGALVESSRTTEASFTFVRALTGTYDTIEIKVICDFTYAGYRFRQTVYADTIDELTEVIDASTVSIPLESVYQSHKHDETDSDYFKLDIAERGMYRIYIDGSYMGLDNHLFDTNGASLGDGSDFVLDPGVYYVKADNDDVAPLTSYTIQVRRLEDDHPGAAELDLDEGVHAVTLINEYPGDREWILFTVSATATIRLWTDDEVGAFYYIGFAEGAYYNAVSDYLNTLDELRFLVPAGTYYLGFHDPAALTSMTFHFEATFVEDDLSGDVADPDADFGTLAEGDNLIVIDGPWDRDVYTLTTDADVIVQFVGNNSIRSCLVTAGGEVCHRLDEPYLLTAGTHNFVLYSISSLAPFAETKTVMIYRDLSDPDHPIPIAIGDTITVVIDRDPDFDYYAFSLTELMTLRFSIEDGHNSFEIYDVLGTKVFDDQSGDSIFQLAAGTYTLKIIGSLSGNDIIAFYAATFAVYDTGDADPGIAGLPIDFYRAFEIEYDHTLTLESTSEYRGDCDIFRLRVTTAGSYRLTFTSVNTVNVYLIDENGTSVRWSNGSSMELAYAYYYLKVVTTGQFPVVYRWSIAPHS